MVFCIQNSIAAAYSVSVNLSKQVKGGNVFTDACKRFLRARLCIAHIRYGDLVRLSVTNDTI